MNKRFYIVISALTLGFLFFVGKFVGICLVEAQNTADRRLVSGSDVQSNIGETGVATHELDDDEFGSRQIGVSDISLSRGASLYVSKNTSEISQTEFLPVEKAHLANPHNFGEIVPVAAETCQEYMSVEGETVKEYSVKVSQNTLKWSSSAGFPEVGDIIAIKILNHPTFLFQVDSSKADTTRERMLFARQYNSTGDIYISYADGKLCMRVYDALNERLFNVFYSDESEQYCVREISCKDSIGGIWEGN